MHQTTFTSLVESFRKSTTARKHVQCAIFGHSKCLWFIWSVLGLRSSLSFAFTFKKRDFRISPPLKWILHFTSIFYLSLCPFLCLYERLSAHGSEGLQSFWFLRCRPMRGMQEGQTSHISNTDQTKTLNVCTILAIVPRGSKSGQDRYWNIPERAHSGPLRIPLDSVRGLGPCRRSPLHRSSTAGWCLRGRWP